MEFHYDAERIYALDAGGKLIAEITFPITDGIASIDHTFVDRSLRGQGIAGQLMEAAVAQLRRAGLKITLTCPYAVKWFEDHPEQADLL